MKVSRFESFKSKQTGALIKVSKVVRSTANSRSDNCVVRNYENGKPQPGSVRVVFADSIRRRYWKV